MTQSKTEFEEAGQEKPMPLVQEFFLFIRENKAWWLTPIVLVLGLVGGLAYLAGGSAGPFLYTFF